ncbi:MAG TPA: prephenate dehydrogenase/arogenate dehydrogenase family protein, partial [Gemmatales bacterium]|nr:prephenate dehydrogenase/arogenate dehydrogenase family protein [Gemmatales bacterium]
RVTDVGSTKLTILEAINLRSELASRFIGGHPLAGSEKSGPEHAQKDLFRNKMVFLSPSITTSSTTLQLVTTFWKSLQAITIEISPEKHDTVMAFTSHLPHLISFTLAGVIPQDYIEYSGTGLRSMCRLAGGDPSMWSAIVKENREPILNCLDLFQGNLNTLRRAIEKNNPSLLSNLFDAGRRTYHALGS